MASRGTHNGTVVCPSGNRRNVAQLGSRMRRAGKTRGRAVRAAQCFHPAQQLSQGRCRCPGTGLILRYEVNPRPGITWTISLCPEPWGSPLLWASSSHPRDRASLPTGDSRPPFLPVARISLQWPAARLPAEPRHELICARDRLASLLHPPHRALTEVMIELPACLTHRLPP